MGPPHPFPAVSGEGRLPGLESGRGREGELAGVPAGAGLGETGVPHSSAAPPCCGSPGRLGRDICPLPTPGLHRGSRGPGPTNLLGSVSPGPQAL